MTHKWGRMATFPKLGDSQISLREERPDGETPHSMRVSVPSPNRPYPWSSGARNLGGKFRGRCKEGPYQDRPPLCPFRLLPLLIYSGSTIAFLKYQGPKSKNIENVILLQP